MPACPNCQTPQPDGAAFCDNCGASLAGAVPAAPLPTPMPAATTAAPTCPACGAAVMPGEAFCESCGAALGGPAPAPMPSVPSAAAPAGVPTPPAAGTCPTCGAALEPGSNFCDSCGASVSGTPGPSALPTAQPPYVPPPPPGPPYVPPMPGAQPAYGYPMAGPVQGRLVVQGTNVTLPFPPGKTEIIVGREDPISNVFPDVDLTNYGGDEGGVSRRHARIFMQGSQVMVEDLNSTNYTFVNQQRLTPGQPHPVQNGDEVRFGRVKLNFYL